jgi:hypothetical protein
MPSRAPSVSLGGFDINKPPSTSLGMGRLVNPLGEPKLKHHRNDSYKVYIKETKTKGLKLKKIQHKDASEVLGLKGFW